jgi:hypothetical protein
MPIFISYSRVDSNFATRLAHQLVKRRANVWIDQWELHVGDSLIQKIQDAIEGASAILVILSKASVESEWCKKELSSGLVLELEKKRVIVLPVLMEDCKIPMFLKDKLYADFRTDFDKGLRDVLEAIARVTSDSLTRTEAPDWYVDWAVDWVVKDNRIVITLTAVEHAVGSPLSVLTEVIITGNEAATDRYRAMTHIDLGWVEKEIIIEFVCDGIDAKDLRFRLEDEKAKTVQCFIRDTKSQAAYDVFIKSRRLGEDTGKDILLDLTGHLRTLSLSHRGTNRKLNPEEESALADTRRRFKRSEEPSSPFGHVKF